MLPSPKLPYSKYIQTLVLINSDNVSIQDNLDARRLPVPSNDYLQTLRQHLYGEMPQSVRNFYASNTGILIPGDFTGDVRAYMYDLGLDDYFEAPIQFAAARAVFDDGDLRLFTNVHLLKRVGIPELYGRLADFAKYSAQSGTLEIYSRIFWDVDGMDFSSWKILFHDLRDRSYGEMQMYARCFSARFSIEVLRWILQADSGQVDPKSMLEQFMRQLFFRSMEQIETGSTSEKNQAVEMMSVFAKLLDKYQAMTQTTVDPQALLKEAMLQLKRVRSPIPKISELDGAGTTALPPVQAPSVESDDDPVN